MQRNGVVRGGLSTRASPHYVRSFTSASALANSSYRDSRWYRTVLVNFGIIYLSI